MDDEFYDSDDYAIFAAISAERRREAQQIEEDAQRLEAEPVDEEITEVEHEGALANRCPKGYRFGYYPRGLTGDPETCLPVRESDEEQLFLDTVDLPPHSKASRVKWDTTLEDGLICWVNGHSNLTIRQWKTLFTCDLKVATVLLSGFKRVSFLPDDEGSSIVSRSIEDSFNTTTIRGIADIMIETAKQTLKDPEIVVRPKNVNRVHVWTDLDSPVYSDIDNIFRDRFWVFTYGKPHERIHVFYNHEGEVEHKYILLDNIPHRRIQTGIVIQKSDLFKELSGYCEELNLNKEKVLLLDGGCNNSEEEFQRDLLADIKGLSPSSRYGTDIVLGGKSKKYKKNTKKNQRISK